MEMPSPSLLLRSQPTNHCYQDDGGYISEKLTTVAATTTTTADRNQQQILNSQQDLSQFCKTFENIQMCAVWGIVNCAIKYHGLCVPLDPLEASHFVGLSIAK